MDVLALDLLRSTSGTRHSRPVLIRQRTQRPVLPRGRHCDDPHPRGSGAGPGGVGGAAAARRNGLLAYTGASIVLGLGLLAWTSFVAAPLPAIDPGFPPGTVLSGPTGGLLLWLVFGLLGSLRVLRARVGPR